MRRMWFRLRAALRRVLDGGARDQELSEELRAFVEHDAESKIRSGMTPEAARRAALIEMGGAEQVKERVREVAAGARWESIFRDIRYAMRSLASGTRVLVLGDRESQPGAGGDDRGLRVHQRRAASSVSGCPGSGSPRDARDSGKNPLRIDTPLDRMADYPDVFRALGEGMTSLDGLASFTESDVAVTLPQPRSLPAAFVSPNYFDVLGVQPEIGRDLCA